MAHAITPWVRKSSVYRQRTMVADDPLDAARGILLGALVSMLGFWLPLALALLQ